MKAMETLMEIIRNFKPVDAQSFNENTHLRRDLGLDSLQIAAITGDIEDAFGVEISDAEAADAATVGDLLRLAKKEKE